MPERQRSAQRVTNLRALRGARRSASRLHPQFPIRLPGIGAVLVALMLVAPGCGMKRESGNSTATRSSALKAPASPVATGSTEAVDASGSSAVSPNAIVVPRRREIIYTGEMSLEVDDVEKTTNRLERMLVDVQGWVSGRQLNVDAEGRRVATIAMRIPVAQFSHVHDSVRGLGEIVHDEVQSQDVGMEFVDIEARQRNLQREEAVISGLYARGGRIDDVLQVERELARVRGEIEQAQGRLRYLTDQVSLSTLSITLTPRRPAIERKVASWNMGYHLLRAWNMLVAFARGFTYLVVYMTIVVGPFALLGWAIWWFVRRRRR